MTAKLGRLSRDTTIAFGLAVVLAIIYVYVFPRWADPNQDSRLKMVIAVVDDGTLQIDKYLGTTVDYAKVNGHYYSDKAPGVAFLGIPVYAALRQLPVFDALAGRLENSAAFQTTLRTDGSGVNSQKVRFALAQVAIALIVGVVPSAITGALIFLWLSRIAPGVVLRLTVALGYGLLTPAYAYANSMYGHQLSAALLLGAFYLISTARRLPPAWVLAVIGVLLSYAVVTEYPVAVVTACLYLYTAFRLNRLGSWASLIWVTVTAVAVASGWMAYNNFVFGGPLNLGYSYSELWVSQHQTGFMSLSLPSPLALWGITFGTFRGLFPLAPWLLLAIPGFWLWWRSGQQRPEFWVVIVICVGILSFNASSVMWWGGFAIGPRYILPMLPFYVLAIAFPLREWATRRGFVAGLVVALLWSWLAVWGLTLAEQAFPSDAIANPLLDYAWPHWQSGNVARNMGTLLGLRGGWSLAPLLGLLALVAAVFIGRHNWLRRHVDSQLSAAPDLAR